MIFATPLPFIEEFIEQLNQGIQECAPSRKLSQAQRWWSSFCLMGIPLSNQVCWAGFERVGLGGYRLGALSWMFRHGKLPWSLLLQVSVKLVLRRYGIAEGVLVGDGSDRRRAKVTKRIFATHKVFDKKTGGYFNGQTVVLPLLVTSKVSLPVGFRFHRPDPAVVEWKKADEALKKQGVGKCARPPKPTRNPAYPSKPDLLLDLLREFGFHHPRIQVETVLADALYGSARFMNRAAKRFADVQTVSQLQKTQLVRFRNRDVSVADCFRRYPGVEITLRIRGGKEVNVVPGSARLFVKAHEQKRFVVALKYRGETEYRYPVASGPSWRAVDIAAAYTLRWLVEVFFEDWKLHQGWGRCAPQFDEEGSSRSLIPSLLLDDALLLHPEQQARVENNLPACTVGSLQQQSRMDALVEVIRGVVDADNPHEKLDEIAKVAKRLFPLRPSAKQMSGREPGRLEPTPSLKYRAQACLS